MTGSRYWDAYHEIRAGLMRRLGVQNARDLPKEIKDELFDLQFQPAAFERFDDAKKAGLASRLEALGNTYCVSSPRMGPR